MGKGTESCLKLRCVHCGSTETPLWRAGPDGPKTLCNACGVRYKKGKLVLFRDAAGNLTAVKRENEAPVHFPLVPKKSNKNVLVPSDPPPKSLIAPSSVDSTPGRTVQRVPSEGVVAQFLAKQPRSRSRRTNAGQMPERYAPKTCSDGLTHWHSHLSSPRSCSPPQSPRNGGTFHLLVLAGLTLRQCWGCCLEFQLCIRMTLAF